MRRFSTQRRRGCAEIAEVKRKRDKMGLLFYSLSLPLFLAFSL
jgi:hypothetical protein